MRMRQRFKYVERNAIVKVKHFIVNIVFALNMSNSSVIDSGSESVWCYIRYLLKMSSFMLKIRLKYFLNVNFLHAD